MNRKKISTHDLCYIGIFTAIISICAQISIPMPYGVPMTLQTFAIPLAGIILGAKKGTLATLAYVLLGIVGAPVFSGLKGGFSTIIGPTGGFIISFPIMALTAGIGEEKCSKIWLSSGLILGTVINFLCGMFFYDFVTSNGLKMAFTTCVLPFIPVSIIKMVLAATLGKAIKAALSKSKVLK